MARDFETTDYSAPQPPSATVTKTEARQGQNVRGMLTVLVVSLLLIAALYGVMLALTTQTDNAGDRTAPSQTEGRVVPGEITPGSAS